MEWIFAVPDNHQECSTYKAFIFPGGLYAVATSKDMEEDCNNTRKEISKWVSESGCFIVLTPENDENTRYIMNHVITPKIFKEKMGYHLCDNFVPIIVK